MRGLLVILLIICLTAQLQAKDFKCSFKKVFNEATESDDIACELKNVRYDQRQSFNVFIDRDEFMNFFDANFKGVATISEHLSKKFATTTTTTTTTAVPLRKIVIDAAVESSLDFLNSPTNTETTTVAEISSNETTTVTETSNNETVTATEAATLAATTLPETTLPPTTTTEAPTTTTTQRSKFSEEKIGEAVKIVTFRNSKVATISSVIFRTKFQKLEVLDASSVQLKNLNALSLNGAGSLLKIFFQNNQLTSITHYTFVHTKELRILELSNNNIKSVAGNAFVGLGKLEKLSLSNNYIESFEDTVFQPLTSVEWIMLDRNRISMLSTNVFGGVNGKLQGIFLNANKINEISPYLLDRIPKLRFLNLEGNSCTGANFKDHLVFKNTAIRYELRNCYKRYNKLGIDDSSLNSTQRLYKVENQLHECEEEAARYSREFEMVLDKIRTLKEELRKTPGGYESEEIVYENEGHSAED